MRCDKVPRGRDRSTVACNDPHLDARFLGLPRKNVYGEGQKTSESETSEMRLNSIADELLPPRVHQESHRAYTSAV